MHEDPLLKFDGPEVVAWLQLDPAQRDALADWIHQPWTRHVRHERLSRLREALRLGEAGMDVFLHRDGLPLYGAAPPAP